MLKDTKSLGNNKAPACESRGFVHKKRGVHFDTPPLMKQKFPIGETNLFDNLKLLLYSFQCLKQIGFPT